LGEVVGAVVFCVYVYDGEVVVGVEGVAGGDAPVPVVLGHP